MPTPLYLTKSLNLLIKPTVLFFISDWIEVIKFDTLSVFLSDFNSI